MLTSLPRLLCASHSFSSERPLPSGRREPLSVAAALSAQWWLNMQSVYDLKMAEKEAAEADRERGASARACNLRLSFLYTERERFSPLASTKSTNPLPLCPRSVSSRKRADLTCARFALIDGT